MTTIRALTGAALVLVCFGVAVAKLPPAPPLTDAQKAAAEEKKAKDAVAAEAAKVAQARAEDRAAARYFADMKAKGKVVTPRADARRPRRRRSARAKHRRIERRRKRARSPRRSSDSATVRGRGRGATTRPVFFYPRECAGDVLLAARAAPVRSAPVAAARRARAGPASLSMQSSKPALIDRRRVVSSSVMPLSITSRIAGGRRFATGACAPPRSR